MHHFCVPNPTHIHTHTHSTDLLLTTTAATTTASSSTLTCTTAKFLLHSASYPPTGHINHFFLSSPSNFTFPPPLPSPRPSIFPSLSISLPPRPSLSFLSFHIYYIFTFPPPLRFPLPPPLSHHRPDFCRRFGRLRKPQVFPFLFLVCQPKHRCHCNYRSSRRAVIPAVEPSYVQIRLTHSPPSLNIPSPPLILSYDPSES